MLKILLKTDSEPIEVVEGVTDRCQKDATETCRDQSGDKESLGSPGHHGVIDGSKTKENDKFIPNSSHGLASGRRQQCKSSLEQIPFWGSLLTQLWERKKLSSALTILLAGLIITQT